MKGPGQKFLAGTGFPLDKHRAVAFRHKGQNLEDPVHGGAAADHIPHLIARIQFLAQLLHHAHITKGFHSAQHRIPAIFQQTGGYHHGNTTLVAVHDIGGRIHKGLTLFHGATKGTVGFTHVGPKHLPAMFPQGLFPGNSGDPFRGPVKGGDAPVMIHGEHPVGNAVQDDLGHMGRDLVGFFFFHGLLIFKHDAFMGR